MSRARPIERPSALEVARARTAARLERLSRLRRAALLLAAGFALGLLLAHAGASVLQDAAGVASLVAEALQ